MRFTARRPNPVFSPEYRLLVTMVVEERRRVGLSQRALADRLGKSPSHVAMIERGQRRIDALELYLIGAALGLNPVEFFKAIATKLNEANPVTP